VQLQEIDDLIRSEHTFISAEDNCYFLREYTAGAGFGHGETNNLISNLKKKMDRRGRPEWRYKEAAILQAGQELRQAIGEEALKMVTIVPMPPSCIKENPMYDDRMLQIVRAMTYGIRCDVRELVLQSKDMPAAHETSARPRPNDWYSVYYIDESIASPPPVNVLVIDDVLTAGAHFAGLKRRVHERFPSARIFGCFYARRAVQQSADDDDWR
jgi:hypothetical protein